jgi:hypothetical protein
MDLKNGIILMSSKASIARECREFADLSEPARDIKVIPSREVVQAPCSLTQPHLLPDLTHLLLFYKESRLSRIHWRYWDECET